MSPLVLLLALVTTAAADFDAYRDVLVAGDVGRMEALLKADDRRLPVDPDGVTVLHKALHVYSEHRLRMVELLLAAGADPNAAMRDGRRPLHFAAAFDVPAAVPLLLAAGATVDTRDEDGCTPLFSASRDVAALLLAAGADVRVRDREGNVPFHRNWLPVLQAPGVNVRNTAGLTPLHFAALAGNERAVQWLLAQGAHPSATTTTPTHWRASFMSKAFGPGDPVPAGARPLDLARAQHEQTKWSSGRYRATLEALEEATPRRGWFRR